MADDNPIDASGAAVPGVQGGIGDTVQRLAAIVESSDDAIISKDLNGVISSWNRGAERLFGYSAAEAVGQPVTMLIPSDRHDEEPDILSRIRRGERVDHYETVRRRKDGTLIDISLCVSPIRDGAGTVIGASKIARDISERRRTEERQDLLLREMNHRIKNLFALASGVVALSARTAETPMELAAAVRDRLDALARAHSLTMVRSPRDAVATEPPATLHALVEAIASPYQGQTLDGRARVSVSGIDMKLAQGPMASLALLLHEFATNAAKYGALSTADGHVAVECFEGDGRLVVVWSERGGPPVARESEVDGFGTLLSRATVEGQLAGTIVRDWDPGGLVIHLSLPRDRVEA